MDTISGANVTRYAVPIMLTGVQPERFADFYHTPSLVTDTEALRL